ncbi:metalloregulator ArsR/SmtB family transcription factor [Gephyromycinifex aptenodytis]|uniref:metalloregulator ArsR/SmtB family transcription factor n=1 Tax=Gephyromycinifex aptenodytis TaxID=2716227 RepID=UPI0014455E5D|nr:metalloregulator ArsR/SmtB family transcription factor [Gephyromycinifex aptenodytis]
MTSDNEKAYKALALVGKAFANAKRLELLAVLCQGERTVESLARELEAGVSTVSAHLQVLKLTSLVTTRQEGTRIYYRLAGPDVEQLYGQLRTVAKERSPAVEAAVKMAAGASGVEEISPGELLEQLNRGEVVLIDVRPREEYEAGHIPGARSVPLPELADGLGEHAGSTNLVAYCRGAYCVMATDAVQLLRSSGVGARRLRDGMIEWRLAGLPLASGSGNDAEPGDSAPQSEADSPSAPEDAQDPTTSTGCGKRLESKSRPLSTDR